MVTFIIVDVISYCDRSNQNLMESTSIAFKPSILGLKGLPYK